MVLCLGANKKISYSRNTFPEPVHSILGGAGGERKKKIKPFKINPSKEDAVKQMLNVIILTAETARLKLSCGVVLLDLRRERSCISRLLAISKIYAILHQWHSQNVHYAWQQPCNPATSIMYYNVETVTPAKPMTNDISLTLKTAGSFSQVTCEPGHYSPFNNLSWKESHYNVPNISGSKYFSIC